MVGITSFAAYVPAYRLSRDGISKFWGTRSLGGERAVAKYDEDSLTMAVAATVGCLRRSSLPVEGVYFASTTLPYQEKQAAALVAAAADLSRKIRTADFSDSLRAGTIALSAAYDAVKSGTAENIIVAAADCRMGEGKSPSEQMFGEGAAAIAVGREDVLASIEGSYSLSSELIDSWRLMGDIFTRSWEERFVITEGYLKTMEQTISGILEKYRLTARDFSKVVFYGPDKKSHALLAKQLGFDSGAQVQETLFDAIGNTGSAALPLMIVAALEKASPGELILVASYGDGGDAFILKVTENIKILPEDQGMSALLARKMPIGYERYLNWRNLVPLHEISRPPSPSPSITCLWRESRNVLALYGTKCRHCGHPQYPAQRVCGYCQTKDQYDDYKFSDKKGTVVAYTIDYLTTNREAPAVVGVVDFEGGGRMMCEVTECEPTQIKVGMPVEMCFRKIGLKGGFQNYFWKARPVG
ncbi:MAG: OB-fold domain-containing protein [Deltaproteobacteria bacterium]|nr:OB-fold domain-containing protein [Deltaproteobacteria bacterium]